MGNDLQSLAAEIHEALRGFPEAEEEAFVIIRECFNIRRYQIKTHSPDILPSDQIAFCRSILRRRITGEPLAHILGYFYFYKHRFPVSPLTLIPRYDTEILVEEAIRRQPLHALDVGTGTGCIALSLASELPGAEITAMDIIDGPFRASARALGIDRVNFINQDFLNQSLWQNLGKFDCIVSNPPYLSAEDMDALDISVKNWEPASALFGGSDGMVFYRALAQFCENHLAEGGACLLEVDYKYQTVLDIFCKYHCTVKKDYTGLERLLIAEKKPRSF